MRVGLDPALGLLPPLMDTPEARAMIVAICLQESRLITRRQFGGPARGYPQFELGEHPTDGVSGILNHPKTAHLARRLCLDLDIGPTPAEVYHAVEFNDVLACGFARLSLWTIPRRLPMRGERDEGWQQYLQAWNPGTPRPETWPENFVDAWHMVNS